MLRLVRTKSSQMPSRMPRLGRRQAHGKSVEGQYNKFVFDSAIYYTPDYNISFIHAPSTTTSLGTSWCASFNAPTNQAVDPQSFSALSRSISLINCHAINSREWNNESICRRTATSPNDNSDYYMMRAKDAWLLLPVQSSLERGPLSIAI